MTRARVASCSDCGTGITSQSTTGRCGPCANRHNWASPEFRDRQSSGIRRKLSDPKYYRAVQERGRQVGLAAGRDPELRRRRVERGKQTCVPRLYSPEVRARCLEAVRTRGERQLSQWCPKEYHSLYRHLRNAKKYRAAEAKKLVLRQIEKDGRKFGPDPLARAINRLRGVSA